MLMAALQQALNKIEVLSSRVNGLDNHIQVQNKKIEDLAVVLKKVSVRPAMSVVPISNVKR